MAQNRCQAKVGLEQDRLVGYVSILVLALFFMCLMIGTVFSPAIITFVDIDNYYDLKRFIVLFFAFSLFLILLVTPGFKLVIVDTKVKILAAAFLAVGLIASIGSKHLYWSMIELANYSLMFLVFWCLTSFMTAINRDRLICIVYYFVLVFTISFLAKYWLFWFFSMLDGKLFGIQDLVNGFFNVRFFNQLQVMLMPLLFIPFFEGKLEKQKLVAFIVIAMHWTVLLQTEARGAMLSLIIAFCLLLFPLDKKLKWSLVKSFIGSVILGLNLWLIFIVIIPFIVVGDTLVQLREGSSGRLDIWFYIIKSIPQRLLFGFGPMAYSWADVKPLYNAHPHNFLMQILYEFGILGFIVTFSAISMLILSLINNMGGRSYPYGYFVLSYSIISAIAYSMFSGVAVMPFSQLFLVFLFAFNHRFVAACSLRNVERNNGSSEFLFRILSGIIALILITVIWDSYRHIELSDAHKPRLWIRGQVNQ